MAACPKVAILLAMRSLAKMQSLLLLNAAGSLPDSAKLVADATRAKAAVIVVLRLTTTTIPAHRVAQWATETSRELRDTDTHMITFNSDLGLVLSHRLILDSGLHRVAPNLWFVMRHWSTITAPARATVAFVGPSALIRQGFVGSLWASELVRPEDLHDVRQADVVIADGDPPPRFARAKPRGRDGASAHALLGYTMMERARSQTIWVAASRESPAIEPSHRGGCVAPGECAVIQLQSA